MRELRIGEEVTGRRGERIGTVERLVVDENAHRVTHIVVDGRLVGVKRLKPGRPDQLATDLDQDELRTLPELGRAQVGPAARHWTAPAGYALGNFLRIAGALIGQGPYVPPVHADPDLVAVHEITTGSPVWHGGTRLGEVARVLTDESGDVSELVLHRPGVFGLNLRLPADRVTEVVGNNVHVSLTESEVEALPEYSEEESG